MRLLILPLLLFGIIPAKAEAPEVCKLYAREYVRIVIANNRSIGGPEPSKDEIVMALDKNYHYCLVRDVLPPLPDTPAASQEVWLNQILFKEAKPYDTQQYEEVKVAWCIENYKTYNPEDGTVLRIGIKERVPCPYEELADD